MLGKIPPVHTNVLEFALDWFASTPQYWIRSRKIGNGVDTAEKDADEQALRTLTLRLPDNKFIQESGMSVA